MSLERITHSTFYKMQEYLHDVIHEVALINDQSEKDELNLSQRQLLLECNGLVRSHQLAKKLRVNKSYISRLVKSMIKLNYICFHELENGEKGKLISRTNLGHSKALEIESREKDKILSALRYLSPEEKLKVFEGLEIFGSALKKSRQHEGISIRHLEAACLIASI